MIYFLAQSMYHFTWCPPYSIFLLLQHFIHYRSQPILESTIIIIRNNKISNPIKSALSQCRPWSGEFAEIRRCKTLYQIFFDPTGGGNHTINMSMLYQKP